VRHPAARRTHWVNIWCKSC